MYPYEFYKYLQFIKIAEDVYKKNMQALSAFLAILGFDQRNQLGVDILLVFFNKIKPKELKKFIDEGCYDNIASRYFCYNESPTCDIVISKLASIYIINKKAYELHSDETFKYIKFFNKRENVFYFEKLLDVKVRDMKKSPLSKKVIIFIIYFFLIFSYILKLIKIKLVI